MMFDPFIAILYANTSKEQNPTLQIKDMMKQTGYINLEDNDRVELWVA
jgi:PBP1b-binding outer membrane lipoprotein LpoB